MITVYWIIEDFNLTNNVTCQSYSKKFRSLSDAMSLIYQLLKDDAVVSVEVKFK